MGISRERIPQPGSGEAKFLAEKAKERLFSEKEKEERLKSIKEGKRRRGEIDLTAEAEAALGGKATPEELERLREAARKAAGGSKETIQ